MIQAMNYKQTGRIHQESKILNTFISLAYFILCHVMQRKFKNSARAEPSFLLLNPFVFGRVLVS